MPCLTTQKSFYVEISRARDRAELVTDDAKALNEQLEAVTGERISALEGIGEMEREEPEKATAALQVGEERARSQVQSTPLSGPESSTETRQGLVPVRERDREMELGL